MISSSSHRIGWLSLLLYGGLALPLAFSGLPMYVYAPDLYTTFHGVPLQQMGFFLLGIRLVDAVQDPLIGALSDRWSRWRFTIIAAGLVLLTISFALLYNPLPTVPPLIWFAASMVGAAFAFSVVSINYNALGSLWSADPQNKTIIVAAREGIGLAGLLLATMTPALLRLHFPLTVSYRIYTTLFIAVALATLLLFLRWRVRCAQDFSDKKKADVAGFDPRLFFQRPFASLFLVYAVSTLASSIPGILVIFYVRDYLHEANLTGPFLAVYFLAGIVGMPVWKALAGRIGKRQSWTTAMLLALVCFVGAYWLRAGDAVGYGVVCFFSGLALGAEIILPLSIASDLIDDSGQQARTSSVFAGLLFISKLSLALASGGAFLLLSHIGYKPGAPPSAQADAALGMVYALVPSGIKLAAVFLSPLIADPQRR